MFPSRKNLMVGMGIINTTTVSELKAILAHEFGHYSQKSLKSGGYVYQANKVLHGLLQEDEAFDSLFQKIGQWTFITSVFSAIAYKVVSGIWWLLSRIYLLINSMYLALSREMEFHADAVATRVVGSSTMHNSLLRTVLADHSYNSVLQTYEGKIEENIRSRNIYPEQLVHLHFVARQRGFELEGAFPRPTLAEMNRYNKSRMVVEDQWASHPDLEQRLQRVEQMGVTAEHQDHMPASVLFRQADAYEKQLTDGLFALVPYPGEVVAQSAEDYTRALEKDIKEYSFSPLYNGYYDDYCPEAFAIEKTGATKPDSPETFFSDKMENLVYEVIGLETDIGGLEYISDKGSGIKTFDYDGEKYKRKDSFQLLVKCRKELQQKKALLRENDIAVYHYFSTLTRSEPESQKLDIRYQDVFKATKEFDRGTKLAGQIQQDLAFIEEVTPYHIIERNFDALQPLETELRTLIKRALWSGSYAGCSVKRRSRA